MSDVFPKTPTTAVQAPKKPADAKLDKSKAIEPAKARKVPTLAELRADATKMELARTNAANVLLNQPPEQKWIKKHPIVNNHVYIPIEIQEWLMTYLFVDWYTEVKGVQLIANAVAVHVRVHYTDITTGQWRWVDGVGAVPLQTKSGAGAVEFDKLNSGAVMMAVPAAKTFAFKDAVESLGVLFGRDLNRKNGIAYGALISQFPDVGSMSDALADKLEEKIKEEKA
jgi:hypothetical protein